MKLFTWIKRIVITLILMEIFYLLLFNIILNMDMSKNLINKIKPEKFQVSWKKVQSYYPFKLSIEEGSAWGASSSKNWKVSFGSVSADVSVLPLLKHKVHVYNIDAVNLHYVQSPAVKKSISAITVSAPAASRAVKSHASPEKNKEKHEKKAWKIKLEKIRARGKHTFAFKKIKGDFEGKVDIDEVQVETHSGPFSLKNGTLDVFMHQLQVGKEKEVLSESKIKGRLSFDPIVFSKNKGKKLLRFLTFETDISTQMSSLAVLNFYLNRLGGTKLQGKGRLDGHINFEKGVLLPGTDMKVKADELALFIKKYLVEGEGIVKAKVTEEDAQNANLEVIFDTLKGYALDSEKQENKTLLFRGKVLTMETKGGTSLLSKEDLAPKYLLVNIPSVSVDDLAAFQRYVPKASAFTLYGGKGLLHAKTVIKKGLSTLNVQLLSKEAKVGISEQTFKTNLDLVVKLKVQRDKKVTADLSGSYLSLKNSILINESKKVKKQSKNWDTTLSIDESIFSMPVIAAGNLSKDDLKVLRDLDLKKLLATSEGKLKVTGTISQFDWLNLLMKNSLNLNFSGHGKISSDLKLKKGVLQEGSRLSIIPKDLNIALLDYAFNGDGRFDFDVIKGGVKPTMVFAVELKNAKMKRREEKEAIIDNVQMKLSGKITDFEPGALKNEMALHLQILSAKVKDIAVYNSYIPKNSPLILTKGTADMSADIQLSANDAKGYVKLLTKGLTMKVDEQKISARLHMDINIAGGTPKNMAFNIAGSTIVLDQAKIIGQTVSYKQPDWSAVVGLKKANIVWRKPIKLASETTVKIKDSRPIVAILDNKKEKHNWLSKLETIENIHGTAKVNMQNNVITFPYAFVKSDKIDIGAKGIISESLRDGVFYFRYKHLKLLLKMRNGKKNLDIFHVKKTFDNYRVPKGHL